MTKIIGNKLNLNHLIVLSLINFYGCMQVQNTSSNDREYYTNTEIDASTPAGQRLSAAYTVIKNNCVNCHSNMNLTTDTDWINSGYVSPGNATSSIIYCRIKGSNCGAEDMPKNSSMSQTDANTIKTWINNL
mgnify:CR=1 FL=1